MKRNRKNDGSSRKKLTIDQLKAASLSVKTEDALSKIVGGTLSNCHTVVDPGQTGGF